MIPSAPREERFPWMSISNAALAMAALLGAMALTRWRSYHNETFDLAFYARLVWGAGHWDLFNPLVNTDLWGLHFSLVLLPLGLLGRWLPVVPMMLVVQAACVSAAAIPLARIAWRRVGHPLAPHAALVVWFLMPAVSSIASYEFHPSALALLPLVLALDFFDQRRVRAGFIALVAAACCREDVALTCGVVGLVVALRAEHRRAGLGMFALFTAWFALWLFVIAPRHLPRQGSLQLHYGHLGSSPTEILANLLRHPVATARALATPARAMYVPRLLVPVAFLSLLRPRWLLPALVPIGINLLSQFPTATQIHSHYSTLALPFVLVSALHGAAQLMAHGALHAERYGLIALLAALAGSAHMQRRAGHLPGIGRFFDPANHRRGERAAALDALIARIPPGAPLSAPDFVLPHVAERPRFHREPPPERALDYRILSMEHRRRDLGSQSVWRSVEEPILRGALHWRRYGVYDVQGDFVLLREFWPVRAYARGRYVEFDLDERTHAAHAELGDDLNVAGWGMVPLQDGARVVILLKVKHALPFDLGFELGWGPLRPHLDRQDPTHTWAFSPFDGVFMPPFCREGEVVRTEVVVPARVEALAAHGVWFGARRVDGSRLQASAPHWVRLR